MTLHNETSPPHEIANPLLNKLNTPFESPPFHQIKTEHYQPAIEEAIKKARHEAEMIATNPQEPDFTNTIAALSYAGEDLLRISNVFFNINHAETNPQIQETARKVSPLITDYYNDLLFDARLFKKVQSVYGNKDNEKLTPEQSMLLEKTWKSFMRNGAGLPDNEKEKLREISRELSQLSLQFNDNVLAETNNWYLHIEDHSQLEGLPESAKDAAAYEAKAKDLDGWVFTLHGPSFVSFMRYASNRDLRQKMFMAYGSRCIKNDAHDNREVVLKMVNLRLEKAKLLGFLSHADFILGETMATSVEKVDQFLERLTSAAMPSAINEREELISFATESCLNDDLKPWDWSYYAEKLRKKRYDFDEELTRPYFKLKNVVEGVFELTRRLWGIQYKKNTDVPVYHPDVTVYEVYDENGEFLSLLYLDFFPRPGKSGGAWMTSFREQYIKQGNDHRPQVSLVCNFSKPTDTTPSLLTFNEFSTYLHEFGHALHGMFSMVTYADLSGTNVYRDFVELPSQLLENWAYEKEFLDIFAKHYQTGETIPHEMIQKIVDSKNFHAAYATVRQLGFGLLDMAWHTVQEPVRIDPGTFERQAMDAVRLMQPIEGTMVSTSFSHIFAGGYASGYYGYKWAEVLDADAFKAFKEKGVFDKDVAGAFRNNILKMGGSAHPMKLYVKFRGKEPEIEALLERDGLLLSQ